MRKIAVAMAKGGVGKTTTAVNLAHGLAKLGRKVLLVDCDTQGQAAKFLGVNPDYGLYEFVIGKDETGKALYKKDTLYPCRNNFWLLAGGIKLVELKHWLGEKPRLERQTALAKTLVPKGSSLDYLIFDCAPGWDVLSVNILMAANEVLCPVALQGPSLEGLKTFFGYLMSAQRLNLGLQLKYILPTMFDQRTNHSFEILRQLRRLFRKQICDPIHYNVRLSEAPARGKTIFEYRASAVSAEDYNKLIWRIDNDGKK
ncbi:MAG: ParA family protein [Deltaproteobacteria bacterium]|nr:MAG: ParA family protein [Deltaproteobacteria bacterium]